MIGDVLASTVVIEAFKKHNPEAEITYLINNNTIAVTENNPFIDKRIIFDGTKNKGFFNLFKFGRKLKKENFDIIIDAYGKWQSILPMYFSGTKKRIGLYKWYTNFFYTCTIVPISEGNGTANTFRLYLAEKAINAEVPAIYPKIYVTQEEIIIARNLLNTINKASCPIIMISVLGSSENKSLPAEYMAEVLDIIAKKNVLILFNYIPSQLHEVKKIYDLCMQTTKNKIKLDFYANSLRDFIGILSQCTVLIGNEGGATNMAKALNIPNFTIIAPWINRSSWNNKEENGQNDVVHLQDYYPNLYKKHPKKYKSFAKEWYIKLHPSLFKNKLENFLERNIK